MVLPSIEESLPGCPISAEDDDRNNLLDKPQCLGVILYLKNKKTDRKPLLAEYNPTRHEIAEQGGRGKIIIRGTQTPRGRFIIDA